MGCDNFVFFFFCKQKTAYEMRISDWSSDVCSSDLPTDRTRIKLVGFYAKSRSDIGSVQDFYEGTFGLNVVEGTVLTSLKNDKERSEEHTSELQSLMRISYAVFCLKKKKEDAKRDKNADKRRRV